jgi:hypothetical protein
MMTDIPSGLSFTPPQKENPSFGDDHPLSPVVTVVIDDMMMMMMTICC